MAIRNRALLAAAFICACALPLLAVTYTVSKDGTGMFKTVQEAVNRSQPGDIVKILDVATYPEQVTIDSTHNNITLTSANPTAVNKPKIVWQDQVHVLPKTCADAQVDTLINFDQNGALRLMRVHGAVIDGIGIDGGGVFPFASTGAVWPPVGGTKANCMYFLQQGNSALDIFVSGDIIVKNCDITNAFIGIQVKDRNEGGIFANANPGDNTPWNVVPLSGFARTGNHVIEYNRVHDNSYGFWCESVWDLGSTIRYNLIFNNHDPDALAKKIHDMTGNEGPMMCGGAFLFKDDMYSPFAIYNNTFWHNFLIFEGDWRPGAQHLIFNNIYGSPYHYWTVDVNFTNAESNDLSPKFTNRMNNCVFSVQRKGAPFDPYYTAIMNGITVGVNAANLAAQGNLMNVTQGFPAAANIRWVEMDTARFLSVDPASSQFLEPKWTDDLVATYIKDAGWAASSVLDPDGSPADLGAIPSGGGRPVDLVTIKPTMPIFFNGLQATLNFDVTQRVGKMTAPKITLFRYVRNLPNQANAYGGNCTVIPAANIVDMTAQAKVIQTGPNSFTVTIPQADTSTYAFFELFIQGTGSDGKTFTSATGFLPYRKLEYKFKVEVFAMTDATYSRPLTQVSAGDSVVLRITPQTAGGAAFNNTINPAAASLQSGYALLTPANVPVSYTPNGITGPTNRIVMFTKVPNGGMEYVMASGKWVNGAQTLPFLGASNGIRVLAGPPATVVFQDPPSKTFGISPPKLLQGAQYSGTLFVYDKYLNKAGSPGSVVLSTIDVPATASFVGGSPTLTITTDSTGTGYFKVISAPLAKENSLVTLQALLSRTNFLDTAFMKVGPQVGKLFVFYGDTNSYNPAVRLEGQVGERLPVVIIATKSANPTKDSLAVDLSGPFTIAGSTGLVFYDSRNATSPAATFALVNGRATVWVSSADTINNGQMTAVSTTIGSSDARENIYFTRPLVSVDSAFYYSRTGFGTVDSVDIFYKEKLSMLPDSITLFWPGADSGKRVITSAQMTLAPDSARITIVIASPFAAEITVASTSDKQGVSYNRPNNNPGVPESASPFAIKERVGPLVMTAQVVERIPPGAGIDTMVVSFSESMAFASLTGNALSLIKNGAASTLTIQSATNVGGNTYKIIVSSSSAGPQLGDSLKIQPGGPATDALGNAAHPLNRPVVITLKAIPASIVGGYYIDNDAFGRADGVVDSVIIAFNKKVSLSDLSVSLNWGGTIRADSLTASLMRFVTGDSVIEIGVSGKFKNLVDGIKTSGTMDATVSYTSIPGEPVKDSILDKAAPIVVDSATYYPSSGTAAGFVDTLYVTFSERIDSIGGLRKPFNLLTIGSTLYYVHVDRDIYTTATLVNSSTAGNKCTYRFLVDSIETVTFPTNGDSLWINSGAGITDVAGNVQTNGNNRKALLHVFRNPFQPQIQTIITKNPFSPTSEHFELRFTATIPRMVVFNNISLFASGKVFDVLGNCVHVFDNDTLILRPEHGLAHGADNKPISWNGCNLNGRIVNSGVYQAIFLFQSSDGRYNGTPQRIKIGVKR